MEKILYKKDKNETVRVWKIRVKCNVIEVSYGTEGGKTINKKQTIKEGKNIGKLNETTPDLQALQETQSKIKKKMDEGYSESLDNNAVIFKPPMLAHDYTKFSHKITFPCYIQPKLDGYRMIYNGDMVTRNNKKYQILYGTKLHEDLKKINLVLDGELYVHDASFKFESYGILRKKKLEASEHKILDTIKYYVFDVIDDKSFEKRMELFKSKSERIVHVKSYKCNSKEEVDIHHKMFLEEGYEGSMIRNGDSQYTHWRSYDLLKYKEFDDAEFKIINFSCEKNLSDDNLNPVIWKCVTTEGKEFDVQSKGTRTERDSVYREAKEHIGKMLSVKFFGYTEDRIPRFPKTLRDCRSSFRDLKG
jgi:ATP-dependent DNA ligase